MIRNEIKKHYGASLKPLKEFVAMSMNSENISKFVLISSYSAWSEKYGETKSLRFVVFLVLTPPGVERYPVVILQIAKCLVVVLPL